jgi:hypothetical protein
LFGPTWLIAVLTLSAILCVSAGLAFLRHRLSLNSRDLVSLFANFGVMFRARAGTSLCEPQMVVFNCSQAAKL